MVDESELVQYFIVNKDLGMSPGKTSAQVAHVATIVAVEQGSEDNFKKWYANDQKKIVLQANEKYVQKLKDNGFFYIEDNGLTEIPAGSLTCVSLGVMTRAEANSYTKRLQVLK